MTIQPPTDDQLVEMYELSNAIHLSEYQGWVPPARLCEFQERYSSADRTRDHFVRVMASRLRHERWQIRVACIEGKVAGFVAVRFEDATHAVVRSLFVDGQIRQAGIGTALMKHVIDDAVNYTLKVAEPNVTAQNFYKKFRFSDTAMSAGTFFGIPLVTMERAAVSELTKTT